MILPLGVVSFNLEGSGAVDTTDAGMNAIRFLVIMECPPQDPYVVDLTMELGTS